MLKFRQFVQESNEHGLGNNDKGVMHEVLVAAHLRTPGHNNHEKHHTLKHAESFREASTGKSPQEVHDRHHANLTKEEYEHHYAKAKHAADHIRKHLGDHGGGIKNVHWTSNQDDIKKLTGKHDGNNPADLVVEHHDGTHTGLSMKVGKKAGSPTLANPGKKTIDTAFKHNNSPITYHDGEYKRKAAERMAPVLGKHGAKINDKGKVTKKDGSVLKVGGSSHGNESIRGIEHQYPDKKKENSQDAYEHLRHATRAYHDHINGRGPEHVEHALRHLAANETSMNNVLVKTHGEKGKFKTETSDPQKDINDSIKKHKKHLHTVASGVNLHFKGKGGVTLASLALKPSSSGGFTSAVGSLVGIKKSAK